MHQYSSKKDVFIFSPTLYLFVLVIGLGWSKSSLEMTSASISMSNNASCYFNGITHAFNPE